MEVGRLDSIHRYPVKSMLGEELEAVSLGKLGIPGDRAWAARDEVRGGIQGGKKIPGLMSCSARYGEEPREGHVPPPEIALPGGGSFRASDADAAKRVSEAIGHEITLWPPVSAETLDHYKRGAPDHPDIETELRQIFGREAGEPLPDIGRFPPEILQFSSPPGTYFDAFPLLLLTKTSLATLAAARPDTRFDVRRFRPSLLVDAAEERGFPEQDWIGKRLRVGGALLSVAMECPRCVMTTHGFADVPKDPGVMRALVQTAAGNLGVYASVEEPGPVRAGDALELVE